MAKQFTFDRKTNRFRHKKSSKPSIIFEKNILETSDKGSADTMDYSVHSVLDYSSGQESGVAFALSYASKLNISKLFRSDVHIEVTGSIGDVIAIVREKMGADIVSTFPVGDQRWADLVIVFDQMIVVMPINEKPFEKISRVVRLFVYGHYVAVERLCTSLEQSYATVKHNNISWYYSHNGSPSNTSVKLKHQYDLKDEYVPWIKPSLAKFQSDFLASSANVLLLIGVPGTGKSSFIRDMIRRNNLSAAITFDEDLMMSDEFFIEFMDGDYDVLVIEDADILLWNRESGNKVMSKLLNASDGLIETKKKIVFTANLVHFDDIDSALIRPGRCFDALMFREMTYAETKIAAEVAGLPEPDGPRTLASLFSDGPLVEQTSRFGFSMR